MNNTNILIIDDEPQIRKLLAIVLDNSNFDTMSAENGKMGIAMAANHHPDLILLDIGLPDMTGHQVLKELNLWYPNPIIILSVINNESDIVSALDNGATDYLTKPFRNAELLARIRSALRKKSISIIENKLMFDELEIDLIARSVKSNNTLLKLTATEYNLLILLAKNQGRVLTHQFILKELWGVGAQNDTQHLRVFIGTLRKKIELNIENPQHIHTESGIGYRFQ